TALTIGGRNTNFSQDVTRGSLSGRQTGVPAPYLFMNPGDPLVQLAEETGGERIVDAGALTGALDDLGRRVRITYQVSREPDPRPRRIEIVALRSGLTVRAPEWVSSTTTEGVAEARAIDLLTGGSARGDLGVGAALLPAGESGTPAIEARVDFGPLAGAAPQIGPTKLRMTVAIELPGEPAVTFHRLVDVADLAAVPGIVWTAPIDLPERAGSIAVIAEELTTGSWGGARVGDAASTPSAVVATPAVPSSTSFAAPPRLSRSEAFARAAAERKLALAFEWDEKCRQCGAIYDRARGNPEVARRMGAFVVVGPGPSDPPSEARVALYDPSGRLFLSWPAIGYQRPGQPLSPGDLTVILQRAAAATPHLLRAHDLLADGDEIDARLAVAFAYQDAGDAARAEREYAEAARVATAGGDDAKAQSARVLGSLMAANQGRVDDAMKELRAVAASPATPLNEAEAHLVTAMILRAQKRDKEAASLLERVLALAPKDSAAHQAALSLAGGPGVAALAAEGSASRPLQLVIGGKPPYSGKTRLQVIVRDPAVSSVAFRADDAKEIADAAPPFEATIDLGATPRRREIRAVARDARGNVVAEDAIVLNERHDEFWVRLRPAAGSDVIGIETNIPAGSRIARVELFVDGKPAPSLSSGEPAIRLPASEDGVVVRALATLEDGRTAEDAMLAGGHGFAETIEARDVEVYASVLDSSGKPLSGLDRSQFSIEENGRKKRIAGFEFLGRAPIAVGIAIDSSSSMLEAMPDVHRSARAFLELATRQGSSAFVVDFDTSPRLAAARTSNLPLLHAAVSRIRADGSTALYDAMIFGLLQLQGVPGKRALIVLSDGRDVTSRYGLKDAIAVARESGVAIYAIILSERSGPPVPGRMSTAPTGSAGGSGAPSPGAIYSRRGTPGADPQIEKIAVESGGRAWYLPESANMDAIYQAIDLELRTQYRLTYRTAPGRGAADWRAVKVTV
ncbi:MAG TPA: VWA domain-containing protein, partial [Thermoanaerobaculia bacterium]|nr:VWA domain-containing protein [Thermoanaerobaculia bacterium]